MYHILVSQLNWWVKSLLATVSKERGFLLYLLQTSYRTIVVIWCYLFIFLRMSKTPCWISTYSVFTNVDFECFGGLVLKQWCHPELYHDAIQSDTLLINDNQSYMFHIVSSRFNSFQGFKVSTPHPPWSAAGESSQLQGLGAAVLACCEAKSTRCTVALTLQVRTGRRMSNVFSF